MWRALACTSVRRLRLAFTTSLPWVGTSTTTTLQQLVAVSITSQRCESALQRLIEQCTPTRWVQAATQGEYPINQSDQPRTTGATHVKKQKKASRWCFQLVVAARACSSGLGLGLGLGRGNSPPSKTANLDTRRDQFINQISNLCAACGADPEGKDFEEATLETLAYELMRRRWALEATLEDTTPGFLVSGVEYKRKRDHYGIRSFVCDATRTLRWVVLVCSIHSWSTLLHFFTLLTIFRLPWRFSYCWHEWVLGWKYRACGLFE